MDQQNEANPLLQFSLSGLGQSLADTTQTQRPLLGELCMQGEVSVWFAPPNTGKTLIALSLLTSAVTEKRVDPAGAYYINADDTPAGLAEKAVILDDFGIHCLAPGRQGFKSAALIPALQTMADSGSADGKLILLDTFKKFADPMSKSESRAFGDLLRRFCLAGGTVLALSHTNKGRGANGKLIYGGTSDLVEDADSAYLLDALERPAKAPERILSFDCLKRRGPNLDKAFYSYAVDPSLSYAERLASVEATDPEFGTQRPSTTTSEETIAISIRKAIENGTTKKMALVGLVSKATGASKSKILSVLDLNTGTDPAVHSWNFTRGNAHNTFVYYLHLPDQEEGARVKGAT